MSTTTTRARARTTDVEKEPLRDAPRLNIPVGRASAIGRDGQPIWRRMTHGGGSDPFARAAELAPPGWTYEWKTHSVYGLEDKGQQALLGQNGWTAVPSERHPGEFMPLGHTGAIISGGLILMERPEVLTLEARAEEKALADARVNVSRAKHGLAPPAEVGSRISTDTEQVRQNTFVRVHNDAGNDIPRPQREIVIE